MRFGEAIDDTTGTCYVPAAADVEFGVDVDDTTGTFTSPALGKVIDDTSWGAGGTEFTGTYHEATEAEVQDGVTFGAGQVLTGTYDPMAAAVFPAEADVWHDTGAFGPTGAEYTPAMVGSDIANLEAGNVKKDVVIDDVTGTYEGGTSVIVVED